MVMGCREASGAFPPSVMPTEVGIHAFNGRDRERRGC